MARLVAFMVSAAFFALNVGIYVVYEYWWNLAAAIFCGALAVFNLMKAATDS